MIGAGPAGLAAALFLARYKRSVRVLDSQPAGGQARRLGVIENYPGFAAGITGGRLMRRFVEHAKRWGAVLEPRDALEIKRIPEGFQAATVAGPRRSRALILATGRRFRGLGLKREPWLRGVLHGAVGDAPRLPGTVCVVGGGETAAYQALDAAAHARQVWLVVRGRRLKAHGLLKSRLAGKPNIRVLLGWEPVDLLGPNRLAGVVFKRLGGKERRWLPADWLLVLCGSQPRARLARGLAGPGFFKAGDVRRGRHRQVAVAAADGVKAAMDCERFLDGSR